jgi:hypothetical protein
MCRPYGPSSVMLAIDFCIAQQGIKCLDRILASLSFRSWHMKTQVWPFLRLGAPMTMAG